MIEPPQVFCDMMSPALTVPDVAAAVEFYTQKLGFTVGFLWQDPPTYAGVNLDRVTVHLAQGDTVAEGSEVSFFIDDVDALHAFHSANGVRVMSSPADMEYGLRVYQVEDPFGHRLVFGQPLYNMGPKLEVERVSVTVRLEKRLAAVLEDLAAHKRMTLGETLEETLLHSFESVDSGGVASPHTRGTLAYIAELRAKHNIDYDSHGSYRFEEKQ
jgi:uncharacterized glyoxalase superfamily protein PhnB